MYKRRKRENNNKTPWSPLHPAWGSGGGEGGNRAASAAPPPPPRRRDALAAAAAAGRPGRARGGGRRPAPGRGPGRGARAGDAGPRGAAGGVVAGGAVRVLARRAGRPRQMRRVLAHRGAPSEWQHPAAEAVPGLS